LSLLVPDPIRRIHVLCGYQSQTWDDFHRRFARPQQKHLVRWWAKVGGPEAAHEIAAKMDQLILREGDLVVLQRGGGDSESLAPFDDPELISAIQRCPAPVLTAIGHMSDVSDADRVATASMSTPSALGEALAKVIGKQWHKQQQEIRRNATRPLVTAAASAPSPTTNVSSGQAAHKFPSDGQACVALPHRHPAAPAFSAVWAMTPVPPRKGAINRLGTASFILGAGSLLLPFFGVMPLVGLILGIVAARRKPRKLAAAGVVINTVVLLACVAFMGFILIATARAAIAASPPPLPPTP
jgi:hypothetical protein